jgi:hypothetical protein
MPKFSIEVPSDWPTVWPAANLSPGQWLRVELDDNGDLLALDAPLVDIPGDEFNALLDHVGIGARGEGASPSTEETEEVRTDCCDKWVDRDDAYRLDTPDGPFWTCSASAGCNA